MARVTLTPKERSVFQDFAAGKTYAQVRQDNLLTEKRLSDLTRGVRDRLGAESTMQAIAIAASLWLIKPEGSLSSQVERAERHGPLEESYSRVVIALARGDTYMVASRKVGCNSSYALKTCLKLRRRLGVRTNESLIAVLVWAYIISVEISQGTQNLTDDERKTLQGVLAGRTLKGGAVDERRRLMRKMGATTLYHAITLGVTRGEITMTPALAQAVKRARLVTLSPGARLFLECLASGATFVEAAEQAGYRSSSPQVTIFRNIKQAAGLDMSQFACFAVLIWARRITV